MRWFSHLQTYQTLISIRPEFVTVHLNVNVTLYNNLNSVTFSIHLTNNCSNKNFKYKAPNESFKELKVLMCHQHEKRVFLSTLGN